MSTRSDILAAALDCFAREGFDGATVREICAAAKCNVAAVNYHFGDKAQLYRDVLEWGYRTLGSSPMPVPSGGDDPAAALRAWVQWYVDRILGDSAAVMGQLMVHELARPTGALDALARRGVQGVFDELRRVISALTPVPLDDDALSRHALSVVGQCLIYRSGDALLQRLEGVPERDTGAIADHIASVSIAAVLHAGEVTT